MVAGSWSESFLISATVSMDVGLLGVIGREAREGLVGGMSATLPTPIRVWGGVLRACSLVV